MKRTRRAAFAGLLALMSSGVLAQPTLADANLEAVPAAIGLSQPVGLAFLGDNEFFVIEKASGLVKHFLNGVQVGVPLDLAVNSASERGLLGIALHPNFPTNPGVYLFWTMSSTGADSTVTAEVPLMANRIDRFEWNGLTLAFSKNILQARAYQEDAGQPLRGNHNGGVITFGQDGKLYVLFGDNGRRGFLQNNLKGPVPDDPFGGPEPDAAHTTGCIFRLNDDGTAPTDNPFFGQTPYPSVDRLFGYGVRNGFGLAIDPKTGRLWSQENGDDTFDEMNLVEPGFNGGWVQVMGPIRRVAQFRELEIAFGNGTLQQIRWPTSNISLNPITAYKRMWHIKGSRYTDPKLSWKWALAPAGIGFIDTTSLGTQYDGHMLVGASRTTLLNGYLFLLPMAADRRGFAFTDADLNDLVADNPAKFTIDESESLLFGQNFGIVTDIETGPSGRVLLVSLDQGTVYEIRVRS
ncbi:MAG TPA: PQQ-dependent sugar dehydrogenase [Fimbriimonadaceae bacterium]|nr:PQQ-dependent sugar dehydrogenase [Fimbriimonadaceae bacterium]